MPDIQAIRNNNGNLGYSNHVLNREQVHGSITNIVKALKAEKKLKHLNTLEKYHIYKTSKDGFTHKLIFKVIRELNNR
jgi:hypothetical protein